MKSKSKVLIASGSRHSIPPVHYSPGVPRIIFQLTEKDTDEFKFVVISKYDKSLETTNFNSKKYLHPKSNLKSQFFEKLLKLTPYRWRKKKYGFSQPDRIMYYTVLVQKAKQQNPDIVVTFMHFELFKMLQKALPNSKHIFFFRSTDLKGRIGDENMKFLLKNSAGFLANTKAPINELKALRPTLTFPTATIYNAVPNVILTAEEQKSIRNSFREKFGLDEKALILGYAGRFSEEKSLKELFQVLKKLKDEGIIIHLIIAGDIANEKTPNYQYYKNLMTFKEDHLKGQLHLAGWITNAELYHFYCAIDVGVLLSKYREGNSMFLIEAMSYGVPVITTDVGGNIEIINDGINGFQIENNNIKENLNNVLRIVSKDLPISKKLRNSALATIEENHSTKKMVALFQDFLKKV